MHHLPIRLYHISHRQGQNPDASSDGDFMSEAKDWAGELISGQTGTGRILVSSVSNNLTNIQTHLDKHTNTHKQEEESKLLLGLGTFSGQTWRILVGHLSNKPTEICLGGMLHSYKMVKGLLWLKRWVSCIVVLGKVKTTRIDVPLCPVVEL